MAYHISYRIIDNKLKKVLFKNNNSSCYAEFHNTYYTAENLKFVKGRSLQTYRPISRIKLSINKIKIYLRLLKKNGFRVRYKTLKESEINDSYPKAEYIKNNGPVIQFTFNFDDYLSKQHVKLAIFLVRFIFEEKAYELIEDALSYIKLNPECPILEAIRIVTSYSDKFYSTGHVLFVSGPSKPITKTYLNDMYKQSYKNNELNYMVSNHRVSHSTLNIENTYQEHLDYFKVKLDEV